MRQVVEEVGSSTVDQSICLMADIKLAQFTLLKSGLSNTLIVGVKFGEKQRDLGQPQNLVTMVIKIYGKTYITVQWLFR